MICTSFCIWQILFSKLFFASINCIIYSQVNKKENFYITLTYKYWENKTKDKALVQNSALVIDIKVFKLV